jgi:hypothetical protein
LCMCRDRTRRTHYAHPTADARKHPSKLILDAGLASWAIQLPLRSLDRLGEGGGPSLSIQLLHPEEAAGLLHRLRFFDGRGSSLGRLMLLRILWIGRISPVYGLGLRLRRRWLLMLMLVWLVLLLPLLVQRLLS